VAVNVYWEKSAAAARNPAMKRMAAVDTWKDAPGQTGPVAQEHATEMTPPPAKPDPNDPGPPKLPTRQAGRFRPRTCPGDSARYPGRRSGGRESAAADGGPPPNPRSPRSPLLSAAMKTRRLPPSAPTIR